MLRGGEIQEEGFKRKGTVTYFCRIITFQDGRKKEGAVLCFHSVVSLFLRIYRGLRLEVHPQGLRKVSQNLIVTQNSKN